MKPSTAPHTTWLGNIAWVWAWVGTERRVIGCVGEVHTWSLHRYWIDSLGCPCWVHALLLRLLRLSNTATSTASIRCAAWRLLIRCRRLSMLTGSILRLLLL